MKRLLVVATLVFAFGATPAMAAPIPHNDGNPDNWGAVYNLDLCDGDPCEFSATSTDSVSTVAINGQPVSLPPCTSVTRYYQLVPYAKVFSRFNEVANGVCPGGYSQWRACVYSPSGFTNGSTDIEFWVRMPLANESGPVGLFAKAPGDAVGNYVYRFSSFEFDQQAASDDTTAVTLDGTYEVDGDPVLVEHDRGGTACGYPELS